MKLSELVYLTVKEVKRLQDNEFLYEAFRRGDFDSEIDYIDSINNAFNPINRAIHRLSDRHKIPFKTVVLNTTQNIVSLPQDVKSVVNVVYLRHDGNYVNVPYRNLNGKEIQILGNMKDGAAFLVEYIEDIPNFKRSDYYYEEDKNGKLIEDKCFDIELADYGIDETMCSYIEEYAMGYLFELIDPQIAVFHKNTAEQYFNDLDNLTTTFNQNLVYKKYGM